MFQRVAPHLSTLQRPFEQSSLELPQAESILEDAFPATNLSFLRYATRVLLDYIMPRRKCRDSEEERGGVFVEFVEGVEGASPDDAALFDRDEHGAQEGEDECRHLGPLEA